MELSLSQLDFISGDKVSMAIERYRMYEQNALEMHEDGYYIAFSGGKDSQVILDLARRSGVKYTAHFHLTSVDPPELIRFVVSHYPDVVRTKPVKTMWALIREHMQPPTRIARYCCEHLKENGGDCRLVVTGVRWGESANRSNRKVVERCMKSQTKTYMHPIIDWTEAEVWQYINGRRLDYCSLYDEGWKRIGCIGCPSKKGARWDDFKRWPRYERLYRIAFDRVCEDRQRRGLVSTEEWTDGASMFDWWMEDGRHKSDRDQLVLFE